MWCSSWLSGIPVVAVEWYRSLVSGLSGSNILFFLMHTLWTVDEGALCFLFFFYLLNQGSKGKTITSLFYHLIIYVNWFYDEFLKKSLFLKYLIVYIKGTFLFWKVLKNIYLFLQNDHFILVDDRPLSNPWLSSSHTFVPSITLEQSFIVLMRDLVIVVGNPYLRYPCHCS